VRPRVRALLVVGLLVGVVLALAAFGLSRDGSEGPGQLAVVDDCGILTMRSDGTDWRFNCLDGIFAAVSVSGDGRKLAWDTAQGITVANADKSDSRPAILPRGSNAEPSLSPEGDELAFLHSPSDDGRYDIWTGTITADDAQQVTTGRNVFAVAWSPDGDWLAYVKNWSENTLEGDLMLVHPDGSGIRSLGRGDAPAWSPDGDKLAYFHDDGVWTRGVDGGKPKLLAPNAHSPAWSRDGRTIAFMRGDSCGKPTCPEHVFFVSADGGTPKLVGPQFPEDRRLLWVTNRSVSQQG
jgi:Tol biopolymer transport system component